MADNPPVKRIRRKPGEPPAGRGAESAAHRAARALRDEIVGREDGELLGGEDELMARLGVSRPTLRQAARLLEHEQVLAVRRGVKGGYYARKPDVGSVAHVAAFYLRARGTTLAETFAASQPLIEAAILRAANASEEARTRFVQATARFTPAVERPPAGAMLRDENEFIEHVLELAGNPPIELFVRILYQFGLSQTSTRFFAGHPERVSEWAEARERLAAAIAAGDAELAILLNRRRGRAMLEWMSGEYGPSATDERRGAR